jgi:hypothetical protein
MMRGYSLIAVAIVLGGALIAAAIAYQARYEIVPFSWGYSWRDRWTNGLTVCEVMRPTEQRLAGAALGFEAPSRCTAID